MPSPPLSPRRILVRGVNWLGDAVMTTPALQRLRERFPEAHITILTPEKLAEIWLHHPSIDEIATFKPQESPWSIGSRMRFSQLRNKWEDLPGRPLPETITLARLLWSSLEETYDRATRALDARVSPFDL